MRRLTLLACCLTLLFIWSCATSQGSVQWLQPLQTDSTFPDKIALIVDSIYLHQTADNRSYLSIAESIDLAGMVNDEAETALTGAKLNIALQKKYFIASYSDNEFFIANTMGGELFTKPAPLHMDPTVCRTDRMTMTVQRMWSELTSTLSTGSTLPANAGLNQKATEFFGSRYGVDTIAMVYVVSRKELDTQPLAINPDPRVVLGMQGGSAVFVALVRAIDGKIVYYGAATILGPQREASIRHAVASAFSKLPKRVNQVAYPVPKMQSNVGADDGYETIQSSPWIIPQSANPNRDDSSQPSITISATLIGDNEILILPRPMGLGTPVAAVPAGTKVKVIAREVKWYYIELPNGLRGWVYIKFLKF